jgi:hypothetical protein
MQNVTCIAWTLLGGDMRASFVNSLDNGSGMGNPSTYLSQCYFKYGLHIGVEYDKGTTNSAMGNLKRLTEKGFANYKGGYFDPEYIAKHGELSYIHPPNVALLHGNIEQYLHLAGFDFIYGFDKVNSWTTKEAARLAWDHPKSKNCNLMITNSDEIEVQNLGYTDLIKVGKAKIKFAWMGYGSESRTSFFCMRDSFYKLPKSKRIFEFELLELEVCHPFNDVWQIFNEGRLDPETKKLKEDCDCGINWKIVELNLQKVTGVNFVEHVDRGTRNTTVNYNERALADHACCRIPKVVLLTAPSVTQDMSIHLANTVKEKEVIKLIDSDDESVANLLEVCGDASIVDLTGLDDGLSDLTDIINSNDEFSDDESLSYENEEFMSKGLWIAGQETVQKTAPKSIYVRFPKTPLGHSGEQVKMCIKATEYWYKK